ncbi:MAG: sugar phosphate isomerase/epimerase [Gemmatales bacterium]|nr:sugar phosphate isomerase/epimerase [Gemmatales bacterium]MDW8176140.1 sugar phosphate isomerase/epimerase [Gemmatales bacterium]
MTREVELHRRTFLQSGMAFLGGVCLGLHSGEVWGAQEKKTAQDKPFGDFIIGAQSYCFRNFDREGALKRIQQLGLHYVEFFQAHCPANSTPEQIKAILRMCSDYGITPIAYGVQHFSKNHSANQRLFEFGAALGIKHFSADPDPDSFDSLDKLCEEYKISIAIHPHGPVGKGLHRWYSAEVILEAVKNHHPLIGTCLDTGHLIRAAQLGKKLEPAEQIRVMGPRNYGLHLKDHDNQRRTDVIYGKGALDVVAVIRALKDVKFNDKPHRGYISIEYEANPDNPVPDMAACIDILKQAIRQVG